MNLFEYVGGRIRELRESQGVSQDALAKALGVAPNTVSRWETTTNKPDLEDLDKLARFFRVSILEFFPPENTAANDPINALLRTAKQLPTQDLEELQRYAEFRRARHLLANTSRARPGRKRKEQSE